MKRLIYIITIAFFAVSMASCGTTVKTLQKEEKVAGYTLKNKKELMQQKILNQKKKTVIAQP
jgi:hypothetical protein